MPVQPKSRIALALACSASLVATPALARKASQMSDLVGSNAASGERALEQRGFTYITGHSGNYDTKHSYWWHAGDKNCLHVETYDGQYTAITDGERRDCNQKDDNTGAAVAAVAGVALLGALLASGHKKGHHDDGNHYSSSDDEDFYDSGFYDGLHNEPYHNPRRADAYSAGYSAGVQQRSRNTSSHTGYGGYHPAVNITVLNGTRSSDVDDWMDDADFKRVDRFNSGDTHYGIYYNRDTSQCVQVTMADGQVYDARDIGTHPKCRR